MNGAFMARSAATRTILNGTGYRVNGGRVRLMTFLIVVIVAVAIVAAAIAMRSEGGLLAGLAPVIHGH